MCPRVPTSLGPLPGSPHFPSETSWARGCLTSEKAGVLENPRGPRQPTEQALIAEHVHSEIPGLNIHTRDSTSPRVFKRSTGQKVWKLGCPRNLGRVPGTLLDAVGNGKDRCGLAPRGWRHGGREIERAQTWLRGPNPGADKQRDLRDMARSFIHSSWSLPLPALTPLGTEQGLTGSEGALPPPSAFHLPSQAVSPGWVSLSGTHTAAYVETPLEQKLRSPGS